MFPAQFFCCLGEFRELQDSPGQAWMLQLPPCWHILPGSGSSGGVGASVWQAQMPILQAGAREWRKQKGLGGTRRPQRETVPGIKNRKG